MEKSFWKIVIYVVNALGIGCLIFFGSLFLSGNTYVPAPDAMIPMQVWDMGGCGLALGLLLLLAANIGGFLITKEKKLSVRLLWFVPTLICAILVVLYITKSFSV